MNTVYWFISLPWTVMIPLGAVLAVLGALALKAASIVASATARGISIVIDVGSRTLAGLLLQVAGLALMGVYVGCARAWEPMQALMDRAGGSQGQDAPKLAPDAFADALKVLGLSKDCTKDDCDRQFRKAIRAAHPDISGSDWLGEKVNAARTAIYANRGWK